MDAEKTVETPAHAAPNTNTEKQDTAPTEMPASKREASGRAPQGFRWGDEYCR